MAAHDEQLNRIADEELMRLVASADPGAFEIVYDRHAQAVYGLAYRIAGSRALADDICQEAFLALWRSAERYDARLGSVRSWLLTITHHRAIDQLRRATRHEERRASDEGVAERVAAPDATDEEALRRHEAETTRTLLDDLPEDQRRVIELAFYSGYSHSEIAGLLALPLGTVKGRMRLGLEKLHTQLTTGGTR